MCSTSPFFSARPSNPPRPLRMWVDALPRNGLHHDAAGDRKMHRAPDRVGPARRVWPGRTSHAVHIGMGTPSSAGPKSEPVSATVPPSGNKCSAEQSHLDRGGPRGVTGKEVPDPQRDGVGGAGRGHAQGSITRAPTVLDGREHSGGLDLNHSHAIGVKRTTSPIKRRLSSARSGSKMSMGVLPIKRQPPGVSNG